MELIKKNEDFQIFEELFPVNKEKIVAAKY